MKYLKNNEVAENHYVDEQYRGIEQLLLADYEGFDKVEVSIVLAISLCSSAAVILAWLFGS